MILIHFGRGSDLRGLATFVRRELDVKAFGIGTTGGMILYYLFS